MTSPTPLNLSYRRGHLTLWTAPAENPPSPATDPTGALERQRLRAALTALGLPAHDFAVLRLQCSPASLEAPTEPQAPLSANQPAPAKPGAPRIVAAAPLSYNVAARICRRALSAPPPGWTWGPSFACWRPVWQAAVQIVRDGDVSVRSAEHRAGESEDGAGESALVFVPAWSDIQDRLTRLRSIQACAHDLSFALADEPERAAAKRWPAIWHVLVSWVDGLVRRAARRVEDRLAALPASIDVLPTVGSVEQAASSLRMLRRAAAPPIPYAQRSGPHRSRGAAETTPGQSDLLSAPVDRRKVPCALRIVLEAPVIDHEETDYEEERGDSGLGPARPDPDRLPMAAHSESSSVSHQEHRQAWRLSFFAQHTDRKEVCVPARNIDALDPRTARAFGATPRLLYDVFRRSLAKAFAASELLCRGHALTHSINASSSTGSSSTGSSSNDSPARGGAPRNVDGVLLSRAQAERLLTSETERLRRAGVLVDIPPPLRRPAPVSEVRGEARAARSVGTGLDSPVEVDWTIAFDAREVSAAFSLPAVERMAKDAQTLAATPAGWILADVPSAALVARALRARERLPLTGVLDLAFAHKPTLRGVPVRLRAHGWVGDLVKGTPRLAGATDPPGLSVPLRSYQRQAYQWLLFLVRHGFGGCLGMDRGLGKTLTTLALLLYLRSTFKDDGPALVVGTTTVLYGWLREARSRTPLEVAVHHGTGRARSARALRDRTRSADVVLTTYGTLRMDEELIAQAPWSIVVLDEAQNINDPTRAQSQVAEALGRDVLSLALSGTPLENRAMDLWAIMNFANPGYLGTKHQFQAEMEQPIEAGNEDKRRELSRRLAPFLFRKKKTDPDVRSDLPDTEEIPVDVPLTPEQAALYEQEVTRFETELGSMGGGQRQGAILSLITRLKMICNHPAQFLRQRERGGRGAYDQSLGGRSHKLARLDDLIREGRAARDPIIIFTQFTSMGDLLQRHFEAAHHLPIPFLHGGTPPRERDRLRNAFEAQAEDYSALIISLGAGGAGLDLPSARIVVHFDRWWNPGVEDQATDRAVRVGGDGLVRVYKFVAGGTYEERILNVQRRKRQLEAAVLDGEAARGPEAWVSNLSNDEIRALFRLDRASVLPVEDDGPAVSDDGP